MADVETEREMSRAEVATYLHEFADKFGDDSGTTSDGNTTDSTGTTVESTASKTESTETNHDKGTNHDDSGSDRDGETTREGEQEGRVTFTLGNESATVNPPETVQLTVAVDSTAGMLESGAHETVSFTLDWDAEATDDEGELGLH